MIIWLSLIIPFFTALILLVCFSRRVTWWELLIPLMVSFILIGGMKLGVDTFIASDTEYWTGWATGAQYYEAWTEEWDTTDTETDSKGKSHTVTHHHVSHHPPSWHILGNNGEDISISSSYYQQLCGMWKNNTKKSLFHMNQTSWGDGNMWYTNWPNERPTMVVLTTTHTYTNKVKVARSVFHFEKIDEKRAKELGLYDYPPVRDVTAVPSILGDGGPMMPAANRELCIRNAEMGHAKQVRIWFLIYHDTDQQAGLDQESYWCGGNKNEVVVCIGVDKDYKVKWCYPFSWCEDEEMKIAIRQAVTTQDSLDLIKAVGDTSQLVQAQFHRKHFKDFNYLTIEPPLWSIMTTFFLTLAVNIGLSFWIVLNDYNPDTDTSEQKLEHFAYRVSNRFKRK